MGSLSPIHWLIVLGIVLVLFGGGSKISSLMGDFAKGIKSFKKNMADDESMESGAPTGHIAPPSGYTQQQPGYQAPYPSSATQPPQAGAQSAPPRG